MVFTSIDQAVSTLGSAKALSFINRQVAGAEYRKRRAVVQAELVRRAKALGLDKPKTEPVVDEVDETESEELELVEA